MQGGPAASDGSIAVTGEDEEAGGGVNYNKRDLSCH